MAGYDQLTVLVSETVPFAAFEPRSCFVPWCFGRMKSSAAVCSGSRMPRQPLGLFFLGEGEKSVFRRLCAGVSFSGALSSDRGKMRGVLLFCSIPCKDSRAW